MHKEIAKICAGINWLILLLFVKKRIFTALLISSIGGMLLVAAEQRQIPSCKSFKVKGVIVGDCSLQGLSLGIPQDLDKNLNVLNLSNNNIHKITNRSFIKYRNTLTTLDMSGLGRSSRMTFDRESFTPLHKLEYLDISRSCWGRTFTMPENLKILRIENCSTVVDVINLKKIEEFHAAGNNWSEPPQFHEFAPLKYVDLRRNPIIRFNIEKIAPHCEIKMFRMDPFPSKTLPESFHTVSSYCSCKAVEAWLKNLDIEHEFMDCTPPKGFVPSCDVRPSERSLELRNQCIERVKAQEAGLSMDWRSIVITFLAILVFLLLTMTIIFIVFRNRREKNKKNKKKHRRRTRDEGVQYEGSDNYEEECEPEDGYYHCN